MNADARARLLEALGLAESIAMRLREIQAAGTRWTECELGDIARTLQEVEDRVWQTGEYAPENVARCR